MLVQCGVCKKIQFEGQWRDMPLPSIKHQVRNVYCPQCYDVVIARAHEKYLRTKAPSACRSSLVVWFNEHLTNRMPLP